MKITKRILKNALEVFCRTSQAESLDDATKHLWKLLKHYKEVDNTTCERVELKDNDKSSNSVVVKGSLKERLDKGEKIYGYFLNSLEDFNTLKKDFSQAQNVNARYGQLSWIVDKTHCTPSRYYKIDDIINQGRSYNYFIEVDTSAND